MRSGKKEEWKENMWEGEEETGRVGNRNRTEQEEEWKGNVIERKRSSVD